MEFRVSQDLTKAKSGAWRTLACVILSTFAIAASFSVARAVDPYVLRATLLPTPTALRTDTLFGQSVAADANYLVVGAPNTELVTVHSATTGSLLATLRPKTSASFGSSVAVSGSYVVVGAYLDSTGASGAGSVYVYDFASATPTVPIVTLNHPNPIALDYFGWSVAISGRWLVIGAPHEKDNTDARAAGSAYVYDLASASPMVPVVTLLNPSPATSDLFGYAVAISGNRVVVGAPLDDTGGTDAGAAYAYDLASATPTVPAASFMNPSPGEDWFGRAVGVSGSWVVVGAPFDDTLATDAGSAYLYELESATPTVPIRTLTSPSPAAYDLFGTSLAIRRNQVVVGAYLDDDAGENAGSAYVYQLDSAAVILAITTLNNPRPTNERLFGNSVALSGDRVLVGAPSFVSLSLGHPGVAYVYDLASASPTVPATTLRNPAPPIGEYFGRSVALSGDYSVINVPSDDTGGRDSGAVYLYDLGSVTPNVPVVILNNVLGESVAVSGPRVVVGSRRGLAYVYDFTSITPSVPIVTLNNPTPASGDDFGFSVAISGSIVVVGASGDDTGARDAGSAYVYDVASMAPTVPLAALHNPTPAAFDRFGGSVAVDGMRVVVGAALDDAGAGNAGSASVYDLRSATPSVPVATLNNPTPAQNDRFGSSVAVSANRVLVGAAQADGGSAYVYDFGSGLPTAPFLTLINRSERGRSSSFAISGSLIVVGAYEGGLEGAQTGSVFVYDLGSATPGMPVRILYNPTPDYWDLFGAAVAVSGSRILVGAYLDDTVSFDEGAAYIFGDPVGTGLTHLESWRLAYFGNVANSGDGANLTDGDEDGLPNLVEFATNRNPLRVSEGVGAVSMNDSFLQFSYERTKAAVLDGFNFFVEWSDDLQPTTWNSVGVEELVTNDDGTVQQVSARIGGGAAGRRFVRLRVSRP